MGRNAMHITVTEQDIKRGSRGNAWSCPLALAISRASGCETAVTERRVLLRCEDRTFRGSKLPDDANVWRFSFDHREEVGPISFDLPDPGPLL
jgi:hypothetical protein